MIKDLRKELDNPYWIDRSIYVGKYNGKDHGHVMSGYKYLKGKGYDDDYCNICLTHSYLNNDITCTAGGIPNPNNNPFLSKYIKITNIH